MMPADVDEAADAVLRGEWGDRRAFFTWAAGHPLCLPFVAIDDDEIVGTGVGTINGSAGWIGVIFVDPAFRGRGLGTEITRVVAGALEDGGCSTLVLVATDAGRPVYDKLGFEITGSYDTYESEGGLDGSADGWIRPLEAGDLDEATALDRYATGEDRAHILHSFIDQGSGWALRDRQSLGGFLLRSPWGGAATIAPDPTHAARLLDHRRRIAEPGHRLRAAILNHNAAGRELLVASGWRPAWSGVRMERGAPLEWHPEAIWGQFGFAFG
jgi:GNAT superfamily N-acetyltransferase